VGISVEWKNSFLLFSFQHVYISSILFPLLQLCSVTVFISEGISNSISRAVANMKTGLTDFELQTVTKERNNCCYFLHTQLNSLYTNVYDVS